jgi:hypothetical protein
MRNYLVALNDYGIVFSETEIKSANWHNHNNYNCNFCFMKSFRPEIRMPVMKEQNEHTFDEYSITSEQWNTFVSRIQEYYSKFVGCLR